MSFYLSMKRCCLSFQFILSILLLASCNNDADEQAPGNLAIHFLHHVNNHAVLFDQLLYTNASGNQYEVSEIQWFLSDITVVAKSGEELLLDDGGFAHYVDTDIPSTWTWALPDQIKPGNYTAIKFTFGLKGEKNIPYSFPNPPESDMIWPYTMGGDQGGYHYMKLNGFWINTGSQRTPFNAHLGVGQEYDSEGNVTAFIQNWFEVTLPESSFTLTAGETKHITLLMDVNSWFETPYAFDFNVYGGKIMKNQEAMGKIRDNGADVFSCRFESIQ